MALKIPDSMEELVYWTSRNIGKGNAKAWVEREECPECHKALMGKPRGKDGKVKIRATNYECPECGHSVEKKAYEDTLTASIIYTCPKCLSKGDIQIPYKRKKVQGVDALVFNCKGCSEKILVTKKMKAVGAKDELPDE
jgi:ssDNA-binding Zn-finger/Zn-ribbon topoisomerase 1